MQLQNVIAILCLGKPSTIAKFISATSLETDLINSYAPTRGPCPSNVQWIRPANGLNPSEATWVRSRKAVVVENFAQYLDRLGLEDFDVTSYLNAINQSGYENVPALGFAISGGGYASAFTGTGALRALDDRLPAAREQRTGGLLQSLLYQTGLSGGSWPTVSFPAHDWPTADNIVKHWHSEIARPSIGNSTSYAANNTRIFMDLASKFQAGFPVTTPDYFGRMWSYEFLPGIHGGVDKTFSGLADVPALKNYQAPLPILQLSRISPTDPDFYGLQAPLENMTTYELTPYEFGAWQGDFSSFTPTAWLGTELYNGAIVNMSACVQGFDKISFMLGSSSTAVNMWYIEDRSNGTLATFAKRSSLDGQTTRGDLTKRQAVLVPLSGLDNLFETFNETFGETPDIVAYSSWPNPFVGLNTTIPSFRNESNLKLVDGSLGGQGLPLWSLIQPARRVDFIFAWDASTDVHPNLWSNGTNLHNSYLAANRSGTPFPIVPAAPTFIKNNYTHKPVFFGCDANLTTTKDPATPIVLYLANAPYSAYTNISASQTTTTQLQMHEIFVNSFDHLTQGNGTLDQEWAQCLGCAAIDRSLTRLRMERTLQCQSCMDRYCWDGGSVPDQIAGPGGGMYEVTEDVDLEMVLKPGITFVEWNATHPF